MLVSSAILALLTPALAGDVHMDETRGFRIEVPDGWSVEEKVGGSEVAFALNLRPPGVTRGIAVAVQITPAEGEVTERFALDLEKIRGGERYTNPEKYETEIAGRVAPSLRVDYRTADVVYRIHRSHLVKGGSSWVVQRNAPVEQLEEWAEAFEAVVGSFEFIDLSAEGQMERKLAELAAKCGSEVDWAKDWKEAAERSRVENKPVLVVAWLLASFTGASDARHGILMDPDLIELINERFVPLWYERGEQGAFVETYGISRTAFGKALIAMDSDGGVLFQTHELDSATVAHQFLRERLARHPELGGSGVPQELPTIDRAERHVARGELARAAELLEGLTSARALRLRARVLRLYRDGEGALRALTMARADGGEMEARLAIDEALVSRHLGRDGDARTALERALDAHPEVAEQCEALFHLSLLEQWEGRDAKAREHWQRLVEEHPDSRFAWRAAQALRLGAIGGGFTPPYGWPEEEAVAEVVSPRDPAPLDAARAEETLESAVAWLLAAQQPDGSWVSPTEVGGGGVPGPEPFVDSIAGYAGKALLARRRDEKCEDAARRALGFVLDSVAKRERTPPFTYVMDYTPWSDSSLLLFLADAGVAKLGETDDLEKAAASLIADLRKRQQGGGGWCYLVTGDGSDGRPPHHSMSFLTAGVLRALCRAREVGFEVPGEMIENAAACLQRMRNDDGGFEYRLVHDDEDRPRDTPLPGAAGRMPLCELALLRAGAGSKKRLHTAIDAFLEHADLYVAESGKALAHAGPYIIGCHYLFFDYQAATEAASLLPDDPKTTLQLREMILASRLSDGAFIDNPVVGRSYATAMAILALGDLN